FIVQVEERLFIGKARSLQIGVCVPRGVFVNEGLPLGAPHRSAPECDGIRRLYGVPLCAYVQCRSPNKARSGMVVVVIGPIVHGDALRRRAVPKVHIEGKQRADGVHPMAEIMLTYLAMLVR